MDALGEPVAVGTVWIELHQQNVRAAPLKASTDCFGVFITYFELKEVRRDGRVHVRLEPPADGPTAQVEEPLDHFYRRSDVNLRYEGRWPHECPNQSGLFHSRIGLTGRIVNRTEPYEVNGTTYHAVPYDGLTRLRLWTSPTTFECPPRPGTPGVCDHSAGAPDARGDMRYSWLFPQSFEVTNDTRVEVLTESGSWNFTVDPVWRVATARIEVSGQGPAPLPADAPAAPLALLVLAAALVALVRRRER